MKKGTSKKAFNKMKTSNRGQKWSKLEVIQLQKAVDMFGTSWLKIAEMLPNRNANQCAQTWKRLNGERRSSKLFWTNQEDQNLIQLVKMHGEKWKIIASILKKRNGKQCRERYKNYLDPQINFNDFTQEEDQFLYENYILYGAQWANICKLMKNRSPNQIKNRFLKVIRKDYLKINNPYFSLQTQDNSKMELELTRAFHYSKYFKQKKQPNDEEENIDSHSEASKFDYLDELSQIEQVEQDYSHSIFGQMSIK